MVELGFLSFDSRAVSSTTKLKESLTVHSREWHDQKVLLGRLVWHLWHGLKRETVLPCRVLFKHLLFWIFTSRINKDYLDLLSIPCWRGCKLVRYSGGQSDSKYQNFKYAFSDPAIPLLRIYLKGNAWWCVHKNFYCSVFFFNFDICTRNMLYTCKLWMIIKWTSMNSPPTLRTRILPLFIIAKKLETT